MPGSVLELDFLIKVDTLPTLDARGRRHWLERHLLSSECRELNRTTAEDVLACKRSVANLGGDASLFRDSTPCRPKGSAHLYYFEISICGDGPYKFSKQ